MAGLDPAIHVPAEANRQSRGCPDKPGDGGEWDAMSKIPSKGLNCVDLSGYCGFAMTA
jgi:hypothetical protein